MTYQQSFIKSRVFILTTSTLCAFLGIWVLVFMTKPVSANTINVSPGDSIQAAIDSAVSGDMILISAGVYTESLVLNKNVSLTGVSSATTIIQAPASSRVISVGVNVDSSVVISGLAITGGDVYGGAGLYLNGSPQLKHLHIYENIGSSFASMVNELGDGSGGIFALGSLNLENSLIENNSGHNGAAIFAAGTATIDHSQLLNNGYELFGGIQMYGDLTVTHSLIQNNIGNGIGVQGNLTLLHSSIISNNLGIYTTGDAQIEQSLITFNQTGGGLNFGGGARIGGDLNMISSTVSNNSIEAYYDPNSNPQPFPYLDDQGGGIYVQGNAWVTDSLIANNVCDSVDDPSDQSDNLIPCDGGGIATLGTIHLLNSEIRENEGGDILSAGGGVWGSTVYITNSKLISNVLGNEPFTFGGGAYGHELHVVDSSAEGNIASLGGGLGASKGYVTNTQISHNQAYTTGFHGYGGGFYLSEGGTVVDSIVSNNIGAFGGGGSGSSEEYSLIISNTQFIKNTAYSGGAIETGQDIVINNSYFEENHAFHNGGAIGSLYGGSVKVSNSIFLNNYLDGPDIMQESVRLGGMAFGGIGAGYFIDHVTIVSELDLPDAAIYVRDHNLESNPYGVIIVLTNSIIDGFEVGIDRSGEESFITEGNNSFFNSTNISGEVFSTAPSIFDVDPQFLNRNSQDFRLQAASPLIGAAQQSTYTLSTLTDDYAGNPRPMGGAPDIGAFEFVEHELTIFNSTVNPSDTPLGTITSSDSLIQCDQPTCTQYYPHGTSITLSASAVPTATFVSWGGKCTGTGTCTFLITQSTEIIALFKENEVPTATPEPTETPTIIPTETSTPIPTGTDTPLPSDTPTSVPTETSTPLPTGTDTPLPSETSTAVPTETSTPIPTEIGTPLPSETPTAVPTETNTPLPTITVTPESSETPTAVPTDINTPIPTVTATPVPSETPTTAPIMSPTPTQDNTFRVTVNVTGTGGGFVTGLPGFDTCTATCSAQVLIGTILQLELSLAPDSQFVGWSAPCSSGNVCQLLVNGDIEVTATLKGKSDPTLLSNFVYLPLLTSR